MTTAVGREKPLEQEASWFLTPPTSVKTPLRQRSTIKKKGVRRRIWVKSHGCGADQSGVLWPMRVRAPLQETSAGCRCGVSWGGGVRLCRTKSFELEINGELVFSKLETGGFPMEKDVRDALQNTYDGKQVEKWTRNRPPCVIL
ncbi:unnamed protein product [Oncorhynchus mykiss]|uniref:Selenoprotein W n=1 Tax=Oncorhynchus mykiss TaxID=8022 RepID=A0A060Y3E5_ONCMY|nr:unnamed protein product [Oncorhynchus mykiss]